MFARIYLKPTSLKNFVFDGNCVSISAKSTVFKFGRFGITNQIRPLIIKFSCIKSVS